MKYILKLKDRVRDDRKLNKDGHRRDKRRRKDESRMENLRADVTREDSRY